MGVENYVEWGKRKFTPKFRGKIFERHPSAVEVYRKGVGRKFTPEFAAYFA